MLLINVLKRLILKNTLHVLSEHLPLQLRVPFR